MSGSEPSQRDRVTSAALPYAVIVKDAIGHLAPVAQAYVLLGLIHELRGAHQTDTQLQQVLGSVCRAGGIFHEGR